MNRCLRCGATNRGKKPKYTCSCGYYLVPISGHMRPVAELLHSMGFHLDAATDRIHVMHVDDLIEIAMITVDFMQEYDSIIFQDLPEGFIHSTYRLVDYDTNIFSTYSQITHADHFFPALSIDKETRLALRAAIRRLYYWVEDMQESGKWSVYVLGGLV